MTMGTEPPGESPTTLPPRRWLGYVVTLVGSLAGGYWLGGWLVTRLVMSSPASLLTLMFGPLLLVPLASALGVLVALAIARQHSALLTAVLTLPATVAAWLVVLALNSGIDTMGYGWLLIAPQLVAPLGARFIVLGRRNPPPPVITMTPPRTWPWRRIGGGAILVGLCVLTIVLAINFVDSEDSESEIPLATGPRECECAQLQTWAESLSLPASDRQLWTHQISVSESSEGFVLIGEMFAGEDYDPENLWRAFLEAGHDAVRLIDEVDRWSATFFEGASRAASPWIVDVTLLDDQINIRVRARVDGSDWGFANDSEYWDLYRTDRVRADEVREERQARAIEILAPVDDVLRD